MGHRYDILYGLEAEEISAISFVVFISTFHPINVEIFNYAAEGVSRSDYFVIPAHYFLATAF